MNSSKIGAPNPLYIVLCVGVVTGGIGLGGVLHTFLHK